MLVTFSLIVSVPMSNAFTVSARKVPTLMFVIFPMSSAICAASSLAGRYEGNRRVAEVLHQPLGQRDVAANPERASKQRVERAEPSLRDLLPRLVPQHDVHIRGLRLPPVRRGLRADLDVPMVEAIAVNQAQVNPPAAVVAGECLRERRQG